ncbi:MAG: hypothetical protein HKN35_00570 [Woeseia sp.]|nr:hypothetical protein [Woeseia sp.]MBT8096241.1 hypothetical protein [Woeseia sp.]NNE59369.1 hypothetical protein [Woeseia sp.]NNL55511.1 hypothetical protein [Woeseia sp.]
MAKSLLPRIAVTLTLLVVLAGCTQVKEWMKFERRSANADGVILGAPPAEQYLDEMYRMATGDPATQAEIFADVEAAATLTPGPSTRLRLALAMTVAGHAKSDLERAQKIFRDLLSESELLTQTERAFATVRLRDAEQRLQLARETERLRADSAQSANSERRATARRLALAEEENQQLRESLAEAEQKLEAITSIERSIREQTDNDNPE